MYYPDRSRFVELARSYQVVPVYRELLADLETPVSAFQKLGGGPYRFLLESVEGGERIGRYSILGRTDHMALAMENQRLILPPGSAPEGGAESNPLHALRRLLTRQRVAPVEGLPPFFGGAVGYLGYDALRNGRVPDSLRDELAVPDAVFLWADQVVVFDHVRRIIQVVVNAQPNPQDPEGSYEQAQREIDALIRRLQGPPNGAANLEFPAHVADGEDIQPNMTRGQFEEAVGRAKAAIDAGDVRQVVVSQRLRVPFPCPPLQLYRVLRSLNPSPYMFFLDFGDFQLVGSSPEVMVRGEKGMALLRPIAGTRPRGADAEADAALAQDLLQDQKERDEHLMLVDLGREDLARVCSPDSIRVDPLMTVERYSHVMHLVSNIVGQLAPGKDAFDLLEACFPAGTVSGSPRSRAMELIDELEPSRRGPYAGAVCYFSLSGDMDSCITIRTALIKDGYAYIQVGAGIVADSRPAAEYEETMNKARGLLKALAMAKGATVSHVSFS